jgi:lisH domain-containing protein FOPNL
MATVDALKDALRDTLRDQGVLHSMRAQMRAEVFKCLHEHDEPKPKLPHEAVIINELMLEYLEYQKWHHTMSVLGPESGCSERMAKSHKVCTCALNGIHPGARRASCWRASLG